MSNLWKNYPELREKPFDEAARTGKLMKTAVFGEVITLNKRNKAKGGGSYRKNFIKEKTISSGAGASVNQKEKAFLHQ